VALHVVVHCLLGAEGALADGALERELPLAPIDRGYDNLKILDDPLRHWRKWQN
jgi:hypothetical protein